ncbi:FAD-binding protein [Raoultibacter timonensis]|uniref:Fumarate reductase n=1 Tax=Raoultibacter timonensis TaxID=1907662 RepID=A0ABM7WIQ9_9ACTN|nr:FAD-binding protein [Raoultibacter timonensis]BDE96145.1 fumarate reductase [Raoultibacter timonensis]BDF50749.1 fumarate reductase [Raoultibacter timonensis]
MSKMEVTRRDLLKFGGLTAVGALGATALASCAPAASAGNGSGSGTATASGSEGYPAFLQQPEPITEFANTREFDVVVVGAGESGLSAVHAALEAGASVACVQNINTVQTAGNMAAALDLDKTDEAGIKACISFINYKSDWRSNRDVVEVWARNSQEALAWWEAEAAKGGIESQPYDYSLTYNGYDFYLHANTYFHIEGAHQAAALVIGDALASRGAEFFFNTPCVQLYKEGDRVTGVVGEGDEGHILFKASKGIIMATGDYVGNREMLDFYAPDTKGLHQAILFRDGSGLCAAMGAGAQMCAPSHTKMVHGEGAPVRFEMPFLFLDRHGERFMDEGCCRMGYLNEFSKQYLAETGFEDSTATKFFSIVPSNWQDYYEQWDALAPYDISTNNAYRKVDPEKWIHGDTFEELAQAMIDYANEQPWDHDYTVESIVASIERYNELVAKGADEDFGKRPEYLTPIEAPCYAVPRGANNIDAMLDGLEVDGNYQCLDADRKPIEGLFAVGNASGRFFGGGNYPMDIEGLSVGRAITTGFATGRYVAGL